jgi:hypothetical protein
MSTTTGTYERGLVAEHEHRPFGLVAGGSVAESVGGLGATVLAILGLAGVLPAYMAAIAAMTIGVALLIEGGAMAARFRSLVQSPSPPAGAAAAADAVEIGGGMSAEFLGGVAGGTLGLLALIGIAPMILTPAAAIALGAAVLLGSGAIFRVSALAAGPSLDTVLMRESAAAAAGAQVLVGVASVTLGILGLIGFATLVLSLVAFLSIGTAILFSGTTVTSIFAH